MSTLNDTTDAVVWSEEFCRIFHGYMIVKEGTPPSPLLTIDEGTMVSWFANAIEVGRSAGRKELCPHDNLDITAADLMACRDCGTLIHNQKQ